MAEAKDAPDKVDKADPTAPMEVVDVIHPQKALPEYHAWAVKVKIRCSKCLVLDNPKPPYH
jgi:hypothetical protein